MSTLLSIALIISVLITTFNRGFFSFSAFLLLILLLILLFLLFLYPMVLKKNRIDYSLELSFVIIYLLFLFFSSGIYTTEFVPTILLTFFPLLITPISMTYLSLSTYSPFVYRLRFKFLLFSALILRVVMLIASPHPTIDVFTILKEAPQAVIKGVNPYTTTYSNVYEGIKTDYYPYWPASFLLQLPFVSLFGDPRVLLVISDIASAYILYILGRKTRKSELLTLIYLFRPNSLFIIEQSWLTPLLFFLIVLLFYFYEKKREGLQSVTLAILTAIQPYFAVLLLFVFFLRNKLKFYLVYIAHVLLLVAPFFLSDPHAFVDKTILVYFKSADQIPTIPVYLSLNINTFFYFFTGRDIPNPVTICIVVIVLILVRKLALWVTTIKSGRFIVDYSYVLLALCIFFYSFYFFFRQAFINYYYLAGSVLILYLVKKSSEQDPKFEAQNSGQYQNSNDQNSKTNNVLKI